MPQTLLSTPIRKPVGESYISIALQRYFRTPLDTPFFNIIFPRLLTHSSLLSGRPPIGKSFGPRTLHCFDPGRGISLLHLTV